MPNVFIGHVTGDFLPAADWNSNWTLVETSLLDVGSAPIAGLILSAGTGLSVNVTAGNALIGADVAAASSFSIGGLTDATTNYIYLLQNGTGTSNTTGTAPANSAFLGRAVTAGGSVTSVRNVLPGLPYAPRSAFGHVLLSGGSAPSAGAGANAGASPPPLVVAAASNDERGSVTFGTGTGPTAGAMALITFASAYGAAPIVVVTATNGATALLAPYVTAVGTGAFTFALGAAPAASQGNTVYGFSYVVIG